MVNATNHGFATRVRPAAVAGFFYPNDPGALAGAVEDYIGQDTPRGPLPKAVIVPHAGFIYSGPIAGRAYAELAGAGDAITRIVLMGPAHRVYVRGLAAPSVDSFETPVGRIEIDRAAIGALADLPQVVIDDDAHAQEHSLEVQLPFIQRVAPHARLVPFAVGEADPDEVAAVLERLWGGAETLIVISSDLSHYLPYEQARKADAATAALIERFEPERIGPHQACGCFAIGGLLRAASRRHMNVRRIDLRNSGDTAGPEDRVVGYGAWAFAPPA